MSEIFVNKCLNKIYLTTTDYTPLKTEINLILNQIITYQKNINSMLKNIKNNNQHNISAEKLILDLRQDLKYQIDSNLNFKHYLTEISKIGNHFKHNLDCLNEHKKNLQFELKDFVELINKKEKEIEEIKEEKKMIILTNEALLNDKLTEKTILEGDLKDAIRNLAFSTERLENTNKKKSELKGELEMINKEIIDNDNEFIKKYDRLLFKYNREFEKFKFFVDNDEFNIMLNNDVKNRKINEIKNKIDVENNERESRIFYLNTVIDDLHKKIEDEKEKIINQEKEKEKFRFLGKYFYTHYKEKHKEPIRCLSKQKKLNLDINNNNINNNVINDENFETAENTLNSNNKRNFNVNNNKNNKNKNRNVILTERNKKNSNELSKISNNSQKAFFGTSVITRRIVPLTTQ